MQMTSFIRQYHSGKVFLLVLIKLVLVLASASAFAQNAEVSRDFYQKQKQGWFWYEDPPLELAEKQAEQPKKPTVSGESRYRNASLNDYSMDEIWNMYPDDFQELLNHVQNVAVQHPTEENLLQYLVMQDVARRKALAYTNASMYVTQKYSDIFNVNQVYPTAKPGVTARVQMQEQEVYETISRGRESHALIYFTSPACGFCEKQSGILHYFMEKYDWQIKPVDISNSPATAERFGIETTPTLLLIKKGREDYMTVSVGVVTLTELERNLYRAIRHLKGETKDDTFLMYDFQKGSAFDPTSILNKGDQPWKRN